MRRYKSPVSGLKSGVVSGMGWGRAVAVPVPVLSSPTTTVNGQESITGIGVDTTIGSGTLSWGVFDAATTPNAATIIAGTGSPAYGNQTVSTTGTQSVSDQIGLSAASDYKTWFVHDGSDPVPTALYWTWPDVLGTGGTLTFSASDNGGDVDLIVYKDASPVYTGTLTQAQYQAEEVLLVAPVISGTAGVGQVLTRDSAALWLWDATSGNSVSAIWQKDGVDIPLETGTTYTTVAGDAGADITYKETLGASTSSSNAISIPSAPAYDEMDNVAGLTWWLDASDTATITHSGGDVTAWADKVGSNNGTATGTPRTGDTAAPSGKNVIDMVAASTESFSFSHGAIPDADETATIFMVAYNSAGRGHFFWNGGSGTVGYSYGFRTGATGSDNTRGTVYYWGADHTFIWTASPTAWRIYTIVSDGTTSRKVYQDGVLQSSTTPASAADPGATTNYIGQGYGGDYIDGAAAEIGRYSSALSTANLNAVGSNLAAKWGLTWNTIT